MSKTETRELEQVTTQLTDSERYRLLASERRRTLLAVLEERKTPLSVQELAGAIVDRETGGHDLDVQDEVLLTLHHVHLPMLDDVGVVDYDAGEKLVEMR